LAKGGAAPTGRTYISRGETVRYIMFDMSASMNIGGTDERFLNQILNIRFTTRTWLDWFIIGPWDILNDVLFAHLVDRTRTRWGKFKPYLTTTLLAGVPIQFFYYFMAIIFWGTDGDYIPKIAAYVLFRVLKDLNDTFLGTAREGVLATITPDVDERSRLTKNTELFSSILGERLPWFAIQLAFTVLDNRPGLTAYEMALADRNVILAFGTAVAALSALFALIFAWRFKERVQQSVEIPRLRMNIRSILGNRPLLLMMLSDVLGQFTPKGNFESLYYNTVIKFPFMQTIAGIPGAFTSYIPYVPKVWAWLRGRFSTKALWILSAHTMTFLRIPTALVGLVGNIYLEPWKIAPVIAVQESLFSPASAVGGIMSKEMRNECMDYAEWKTGFRNEAMTGAMRGLVAKICNYVFNGFSNMILEKMGIRQAVGYLDQTEKNKRNIFLFWLLLPGLTGGLLSLIPKLFYNVNKEERAQMYAELAERRAKVRAEMGSA
jgi:Na+/melibiose symporter-like transporter